jgi:hypothetical protein
MRRLLERGLTFIGGLVGVAAVVSAYFENKFGDSRLTRDGASKAVANVLELTDEAIRIPLLFLTTSRYRFFKRWGLLGKRVEFFLTIQTFCRWLNAIKTEYY